jgi:hypothetical protein
VAVVRRLSAVLGVLVLGLAACSSGGDGGGGGGTGPVVADVDAMVAKLKAADLGCTNLEVLDTATPAQNGRAQCDVIDGGEVDADNPNPTAGLFSFVTYPAKTGVPEDDDKALEWIQCTAPDEETLGAYQLRGANWLGVATDADVITLVGEALDAPVRKLDC